jgi:2-keto-4-pentenoate hydratase/2-oxohepta-3-ene-1,7-dioic acid hydratase in catechol pathway
VPANILAIGLNYKKHAEEGGKGVPAQPMLFMKSLNSLQNPGDAIEIPVKMASTEVDYECELAVVIGKKCKNATKANALSYVLGYTCANDVSARDWQIKWGGGQFCQGKSFDTFCPLGPVITTTDEIPNPNELGIKTILNGTALQDWNTNDMCFDVSDPDRVPELQQNAPARHRHPHRHPHGVGFARKPPIYLKAGDTVSIVIDKIGTLTNPVVNEKV